MYLRTANGTNSLNQYDIRVDDHLRSSIFISFTWSQEIGNFTNPGPFPANGGTSGPIKGEFTNVNWTHIFSLNLVNQANVSYTHSNGNRNRPRDRYKLHS